MLFLCCCELLKHSAVKFFKKNNKHGHAMLPSFARHIFKKIKVKINKHKNKPWIDGWIFLIIMRINAETPPRLCNLPNFKKTGWKT